MNHMKALLVVDIQLDFLAGGALPVSGDDSFLEPLTRPVDPASDDHVRKALAARDTRIVPGDSP